MKDDIAVILRILMTAKNNQTPIIETCDMILYYNVL